MTKVVLFFLLVKDSYVSHSSMCLRALSPSQTEERFSLGSPWSPQPSAGSQPQKPTEAPRVREEQRQRHRSERRRNGSASVPAVLDEATRKSPVGPAVGTGCGWGRGATYTPELIRGEGCSFEFERNPLPPASNRWHICILECFPSQKRWLRPHFANSADLQLGS